MNILLIPNPPNSRSDLASNFVRFECCFLHHPNTISNHAFEMSKITDCFTCLSSHATGRGTRRGNLADYLTFKMVCSPPQTMHSFSFFSAVFRNHRGVPCLTIYEAFASQAFLVLSPCFLGSKGEILD